MTRRAIIIGGAESALDDLESVRDLLSASYVICVNDSGVDYPEPIHYWVTLHPEKMESWVNARRSNGYDMDFCTVGFGSTVYGKRGVVDHHLPCWREGNIEGGASGSSGLFAVQVALSEGFTEIILCGVPMDSSKNRFRRKGWEASQGYRQAWIDHLGKMKGKVYSQSGWTKELLGGYHG